MEPETSSPPTCSRPRLVLLATCLTLAVSCSAILAWQLSAVSPPPLLPGPYMRLRAVYGEPFGHGWGVDIPGYGPTLNFSSLQAHTLKPAEGGRHLDMHQSLQEGRVSLHGFGEGRCLEALAGDEGASLLPGLCREGEARQRWSYRSGLVELEGSGSPGLCLAVGDRGTERQAGPWVRRDLILQRCKEGAQEMVWDFVEQREK